MKRTLGALPPTLLFMVLTTGCQREVICGWEETFVDWDESTELGSPAEVLARVAEGAPFEGSLRGEPTQIFVDVQEGPFDAFFIVQELEWRRDPFWSPPGAIIARCPPPSMQVSIALDLGLGEAGRSDILMEGVAIVDDPDLPVLVGASVTAVMDSAELPVERSDTWEGRLDTNDDRTGRHLSVTRQPAAAAPEQVVSGFWPESEQP